MYSNCLLVMVATIIYGQKWRDAEVRRNFGVLTLSFQMARRTVSLLRTLKKSQPQAEIRKASAEAESIYRRNRIVRERNWHTSSLCQSSGEATTSISRPC